MEITYFKVNGWDGAIRSMFMSKNTYNSDLEYRLSRVENDSFITDSNEHVSNLHKARREEIEWYNKQKDLVIKWGAVHYNLLKFVDFTCTVSGLHRGAQDDFDSHAERFDTRIIRMSTREKNNRELTEVSDYYKGKILTFGDLTKKFDLPENVLYNDYIYIRTPLGYVREDCVDDKDVRRGLIPLGISSTFTFKCDIAEFCHVFRERNSDGNANPELKALVEDIAVLLQNENPLFTREYLLTKCIQ